MHNYSLTGWIVKQKAWVSKWESEIGAVPNRARMGFFVGQESA
jgi:hypothetical protein